MNSTYAPLSSSDTLVTEKKVSKASSYPWRSVATEKESTEAVSLTTVTCW